MLMKASYVLLSLASLGLMMIEAPRGALLTRAPERGKVERQEGAVPLASANNRHTVRAATFVFLGGYHGGK
jgi:hypothetical protein